jgi:hypothetical protein
VLVLLLLLLLVVLPLPLPPLPLPPVLDRRRLQDSPRTWQASSRCRWAPPAGPRQLPGQLH